MKYSPEQSSRLNELGAEQVLLDEEFSETSARNARFQALEKRLAAVRLERLRDLFDGPRRPRVLALEESLASLLRNEGFTQVHTPIIMARSRLEKMGVFRGGIMEKQIFWLDAKRCLRPMLAPHLYEYMRELGRLLLRPIRFFEVGPCFRKESESARHAGEFTMLNLVEMGLPDGLDKKARLLEIGGKILDAAGIKDWRMESEESAVYGDTLDFTDAAGLELASAAMGPLPMDAAWGITDDWLGVGFGLERLTMTALNEPCLAKTARSFTHLDGIGLRL